MIAPLVLLTVSLAGVAASFLMPGMADAILLAAPCAVASLYLLLQARQARPAPRSDAQTPPPRRVRPFRPGRGQTASARRRERWIVVDGSNVMHWKDGTPRIDTVKEVLAHLVAKGFTPGAVFDANAGYKIGDRHMNDAALAQMLGLPRDRVAVVPRGEPADPTILAAARDLGARIVTGDRYREWADDFPEVRDPQHLVRGGFLNGNLWLDLDTPPAVSPVVSPADPPAT